MLGSVTTTSIAGSSVRGIIGNDTSNEWQQQIEESRTVTAREQVVSLTAIIGSKRQRVAVPAAAAASTATSHCQQQSAKSRRQQQQRGRADQAIQQQHQRGGQRGSSQVRAVRQDLRHQGVSQGESLRGPYNSAG